MDLMEHLHLHLMVHIPQHTMVVLEKPANHLMNLTFHLHPYMAVMAKTTHNLHHMHTPHMEDITNLPHHKLMVHLHPHMAIMAKIAQHLHLHLTHPQHMETIAKLLHHNLTVHISLIFFTHNFAFPKILPI